MVKLEEIVKKITADLKLGVSEQIEFENQFVELFTYNLLLTIPDLYKKDIEKIIKESESKDQNEMAGQIASLGVTKEEASIFLNDSLSKTVSEAIQRYDDVLSSDIRLDLQNYF